MKARIAMAIMLFAITATRVTAQFSQTDADDKYASELLKTGTTAPDFTMKSINGKPVKFSKLAKGKYVVLDFWASWCPDCRKDIPNMQRIYKKFHDKAEFIGVSFDTDKDKWAAAVSQYGIEYTQISELKKFKETDISRLYGVKWIPSMYLIDPQGKVVLGTVLSDKLEKTLTETFANQSPIDGTSERLTIDGSKGKLAAILQKPAIKPGETCPMVMLLHGFNGRKDGQMFELIADSLMKHGIASIRFDFNGHGESEGDFKDMTVLNEIEDTKNVYKYVRDLRYVSDIALVGHSQGGVVASMTAGELGTEHIKAVVLMAPAAVLRDDAIRGNTMGKMYDPLDPPEYVELYSGLKLGQDYIKTAFSLPIYETAAIYQGPALIIHGTGDRVVPYTYGERYHQIWKNSQLILLEAFDHGFSQNIYRATELVSDYLIQFLK
ncbi:MAG: alpha/beta fold hydrolase [Prevotella sp.]|nr:alpha/beta fold hydrolase [Prevotella sp.]